MLETTAATTTTTTKKLPPLLLFTHFCSFHIVFLTFKLYWEYKDKRKCVITSCFFLLSSSHFFVVVVVIVDVSSTSFSTHQFIYHLFCVCVCVLNLRRIFGRLLSFYLSLIPWLLFFFIYISMLFSFRSVFFCCCCCMSIHIIVFLLLSL